MGEEEGRLMVVEEQIKTIAKDMNDMKITMADMAKSLSTLAVLEVRHNTTAESLNRAFKAIERNDNRLSDIERALPNLSLASSWVFKAIVGSIAFVCGAAGTFIVSIIAKH